MVFDVKGTNHPQDKIIAFPRFIPDPNGARKGNNTTYGKVYSLGERFAYLQKNHPDLIVFDPVFGETLCEVPIDQIVQVYHPSEKLAQLQRRKKPQSTGRKSLPAGGYVEGKSGHPLERHRHIWLNHGRLNH